MDYPMQELTSSGGKSNKAIASDTASVESAMQACSFTPQSPQKFYCSQIRNMVGFRTQSLFSKTK